MNMKKLSSDADVWEHGAQCGVFRRRKYVTPSSPELGTDTIASVRGVPKPRTQLREQMCQ
ncbi:hypothetical protein GHT06_019068 [Daphnia sinensis]|uniref:Uncharacterized protein n=1 Tax=Daphnia sinensis TaxID=1820382 RepID=A0AAD5PN71_9CRUS|nr:hypothetical protein GHT06_019067 [Daphnia sinensis]KAI9553801.1 hypothetical protein GHT06_019068 [Daphnia sinensis]